MINNRKDKHMNDLDEMPPKSCKECPHSDHEAWCLEPGPWKQRYYLPDNCINNDCPFGYGNERDNSQSKIDCELTEFQHE